mgnify:FL=1|jgi:hypothetical protein
MNKGARHMAAKAKKKKSTARTKVVTKSGKDHFRSFMSTTVGHCVGVVFSAALLLVFNALVAGSSLEIFLGLTAAEIIIAAIVIWIIILRRRT